MALTDIKIDIAEKYLENIAQGIYNRVKAVEEIHPLIKNKKSYAYKLWREKDFQIYLAERSKEIMAGRYNFKELADTSMARVKEMIGLEEREIIEFSSKECCFETAKGYFPNSKEAIGFTEIFMRFSKMAIEGEELKSILAEEEADRKNQELKHKKTIDKKKLRVEEHKAGLGTGNGSVLVE